LIGAMFLGEVALYAIAIPWLMQAWTSRSTMRS
jgi:hypothetical protein